MKTLNEGDEKIGKWWIGIHLTCKRCGRKVELERKDNQHMHWIPYTPEPDLVRVMCETCGGTMEARMKAERPSSGTDAWAQRTKGNQVNEQPKTTAEAQGGRLLPEAHGSATQPKPICHECGGKHEPSGARSDCIAHWKRRAVIAENAVLVQDIYGIKIECELSTWLDSQIITSDNIGATRSRLMMPWDSSWNALVRDQTAAREKSPNDQADRPEADHEH